MRDGISFANRWDNVEQKKNKGIEGKEVEGGESNHAFCLGKEGLLVGLSCI